MTSASSESSASESRPRSSSWKNNAATNWMKSSYNSAKVATSKRMEKMEERLTMEGLLAQAHISLKRFLDPKFLSAEEKISQRLLRNAQGIVFITEMKGSFMLGVKGGTGIVLARTDANAHINIPTIKKPHHKNLAMEWSAPCAVGTGGLSFGFQAGATKIDHIIILPTEDHIDVFMGKGHLQLGGSASAVVANYGRNANFGMTAGPGSEENRTDGSPGNIAPIISYSFGVKGLHGGVSLDGEILKPRIKCNEKFYQTSPISTQDILRGRGKYRMDGEQENEDYNAIVQLLNGCISGPKLGVFPNFPATEDENENENENENEHKNDVAEDLCITDNVTHVMGDGGGSGEGNNYNNNNNNNIYGNSIENA